MIHDYKKINKSKDCYVENCTLGSQLEIIWDEMLL